MNNFEKFMFGFISGMVFTIIIFILFKSYNLDVKVDQIKALDDNEYLINGRFISTNMYKIGDDLLAPK